MVEWWNQLILLNQNGDQRAITKNSDPDFWVAVFCNVIYQTSLWLNDNPAGLSETRNKKIEASLFKSAIF